ncbi:GNAT family N-acetyltransferase [Brooklawnia cerclae]|uniref:GNAT superfamily N-acetyltransferase n=1 Tax=Brooklawnia cerclae TaxID=349934 RepID=A0ABX0SHE9_9ACTN|nr:GNAT family N-acetyltransferase [Brooklawnia cerclae]NIH57827.1 GNAT superfamily N-acetyltransferase [Brooklawnia cerclae]
MTYIADDDKSRLDRDWIWRMLSTEAYWGLWRKPADVDVQIGTAWRVVGIYEEETGAQVGFCRAVSDGLSFAYLADVIIDPGHRGRGLGKRLVRAMIDDGPGAAFRWMLFTQDAHGLYEQFGFGPADRSAMIRASTF